MLVWQILSTFTICFSASFTPLYTNPNVPDSSLPFVQGKVSGNVISCSLQCVVDCLSTFPARRPDSEGQYACNTRLKRSVEMGMKYAQFELCSK